MQRVTELFEVRRRHGRQRLSQLFFVLEVSSWFRSFLVRWRSALEQRRRRCSRRRRRSKGTASGRCRASRRRASARRRLGSWRGWAVNVSGAGVKATVARVNRLLPWRHRTARAATGARRCYDNDNNPRVKKKTTAAMIFSDFYDLIDW